MVRKSLENKVTTGVEERKKDSSTQVERGRGEEKHTKHLLCFSMCRISETSSPFIVKVRTKTEVT